jgi:tetratricopeptide (TPR) repeat protein
MAAFESKNWGKAISYLTGLSDDQYSSNSVLLLYQAHINNGDSQQAEKVLLEAVEQYNSDETIVLQLIDLLVESGRMEQAVTTLDTASVRHPDNYHFPWTRGLVYQRLNLYDEAIESLLMASELAPRELGIYYNLGICYYNQGVEINELAQQISNNADYQATRIRALDQFREAVKWFEKAHDLDPGEQQTNAKLYQLYYWLQMTEKQKRIELLMQ